ncbi:hypothetical protein [Helicobacter pylori]|uniref:hypothetical protein n=1 Tax=Helicobacter pylori TaxID=210 RepID=UPI000ABED039|nr:hypothetical protein [Helicobacter pylori]MBH0304038.1 hypothetical protein [Helicobacter pylori]WQT55631.1 hypothetical protein KVD77_03680 [Helicobacter pylori]WQT64531.1 hypothetical protein E5D93_03875 [Helicobacter pylori]
MKNLALFLLSVGYKKILHFFKDWIIERLILEAVFLEAVLGDFSWGIISKHPLFP